MRSKKATLEEKSERVKKRILDVSRDMFFQFGYSKVTVDEIATKLGMSKRTIYENFENKSEILDKVAERLINDLRVELKAIVADKNCSYSDRLRKIFTVVGLSLSVITPRFSADLRINKPDVDRKFMDFKKEAVIVYFSKILKEGRKNGYISKNVNLEMAMIIFLNSIENLLDPTLFQSLPTEITSKLPKTLKDTFEEIMNVFYSGVLTEMGRKEIL